MKAEGYHRPGASMSDSAEPVAIGRIAFSSLSHFEGVLGHLHDAINSEVERVLAAEGRGMDAAAKQKTRDLVMRHFWEATLDIIKQNSEIDGTTHAEAEKNQLDPVEPYDEKLNRDVFNFQDMVAENVVRNASERKTFPRRRENEVRIALEAARVSADLGPPLPAPTADGALPDRDRTCKDFKDAAKSAQHAQKALSSDQSRFAEVQRIEAALARVQGRT